MCLPLSFYLEPCPGDGAFFFILYIQNSTKDLTPIKYLIQWFLNLSCTICPKMTPQTFAQRCIGILWSHDLSFYADTQSALSVRSSPLGYYLFFISWLPLIHQFSSVQFSHSVVSDSLRPHGPQHDRPPCPSPTPGVHPNPCPLSRWCHPAISSSVVPFTSCPQSLPASESFPVKSTLHMRWPKYWSFSFNISPPMNLQDWFL